MKKKLFPLIRKRCYKTNPCIHFFLHLEKFEIEKIYLRLRYVELLKFLVFCCWQLA
jgi:hypothetical protein